MGVRVPLPRQSSGMNDTMSAKLVVTVQAEEGGSTPPCPTRNLTAVFETSGMFKVKSN